jgi:parallel beta-helix repeat protein
VLIQGLTLTGADSSVFGGAIANGENLTLRNMVLRNNAALQGAGVASSGPLSIFDSEIYSNSSVQAGGGVHLNSPVVHNYQIVGTTIRENMSGGRGGGIFSVVPLSTQVSIVDSLIFDNESTLDGGGLAATGPHTLTSSAVVGNHSAMNGGGIKSVNALTIESSLIDDNSASAGGGIHVEGALTVRNSTISNNQAASNAGGVYVQNSNSLLSQVTVSGNVANGSGGGIYSTQPIAIRHSTIAGNKADNDNAGGGTGGGIFATQPVGLPIVVDQSIISSNGRGPTTRDDVIGAIRVRFSIIGDGTGATITDDGNNQIGTGMAPIDAMLGTLQANDSRVLPGGHYLLNHALLTGSTAIDAGDPVAFGAVTTPTNDERGTGFARIWNTTGLPTARIDIGAFEVQPIPLFADYNADGTVNAADYTMWRNASGSTTELFADGDRNGVVNAQDYSYWKSRFGQTAGVGAGASAALAVVAAMPITEQPSPSVETLPIQSLPSFETASGDSGSTPVVGSKSPQSGEDNAITLLWANAFTADAAIDDDDVISSVGDPGSSTGSNAADFFPAGSLEAAFSDLGSDW